MRLTIIVQGLLIAGLAGATLAQAQQRIEVTGSSIKRLADEAALPLQIITADDLAQQGITSAEQLLSVLGANVDGANNPVSSNTVFGPDQDRLTGGGSFANLRGLGPTGTLVLLNGRRISTHGMSGASVDLNAIPWTVIQRVEILKDGASAIYGTDAIGGVINFILRKDTTGLQIGATHSTPLADGGGQSTSWYVSGGIGKLDKDRFNVMGSVTVTENKILRGIDREWATGFQPDLGLSPDTTSAPHANIVGTAGTALPNTGSTVGTTGDPVRYTNINLLAVRGQCDQMPFSVPMAPNITLWSRTYTQASSRYRCATDYGRQFMLISPRETINAVARAVYQFGENHQVFAEFTGGKTSNKGEFTPFQFTTLATNLPGQPAGSLVTHYPVGGPHYLNLQTLVNAAQFNPNLPIVYRMRMWDWGYRTNEFKSENQRLAIGADGDIGNYSYKIGLSKGSAKGESHMFDGYTDADKLAQALATGIINPWLLPGQEQTQAAKDLIESTKVRGLLSTGKTSLTQFDGTISGPLFKLPGGSMDFALGFDVRKESYEFNGTPTHTCVSTFSAANLLENNPIMGCAGNARSPKSDRDIRAVFAEVIAPITKSLQVQLAVRHDSYSQVGSTTNPKIAVKFQPSKTLVFRGSAGTGFRAPTPQQLNLGSVTLNLTVPFRDPELCADVNNPRDATQCQRVSLPYRQGGNPNLQPEESKQVSAGFVFQPTEGLNLFVDWWKVKLSERIRQLTPAVVISSYPLFIDNFVRGSNGQVDYIQAGWINAADSITEGLDMGLRYSQPLAGGRLSVSVDATKMLSHQERPLKTVPLFELVGQWTNTTLYLPWKGGVTTKYTTGPWSTTLFLNYKGSYNDENRSPYTTIAPFERKVASYTTANLTLSYTGIKGLTLTGTVFNLFDKDPPFTWHNVDNVIGAGWDPRVADPRGRGLSLAAKYVF